MITTEATAALIQLLQFSLELIQSTFNLNGNIFPPSSYVQNSNKYDYIVVGAGTAGCIVASRLSEQPDVKVLLIDAGGDPPIESTLPGLFPFLPHTKYDWNYSSVNDKYTAQKTKNKTLELTIGKLLGGSSSIHHLVHIRGHPADYDEWAEIIGDQSWSYKKLLPYLQKSEQLIDKKILLSENSVYYGKTGEIKLSTEPSELVDKYLTAFAEAGNVIKVDVNGLDTKGYTNPVLYIADGKRQSSAQGFLANVKRLNLHILKKAEVTKILFDENYRAVGVKVVNNDKKLRLYANCEVIICAGALNTPKLLMLSGIGPENELNKLGIKTLANLPVGENLQDHPGVLLVQQMGFSDAPKIPLNPSQFPPSVLGFASFKDTNNFVPDYETLNLILQHNSTQLLELCMILFSFEDIICQQLYDASIHRDILVTYLNILHPESRGKLLLKSSNYADPPLIYMNYFSESKDLNLTAKAIIDFLQVQKSNLFQSVKADIVKLDFPECENLNNFDYWKCYALSLVSQQWHFCGTCAMGAVVDTSLRVYGFKGLRVADASVMPVITSGNINSPVMAIAEKAADMIRKQRFT